MSQISAIKGFADLFSPESDAFTRMERVAREVFFRYGYEELRTPILERTELFCRGIGTETDVVQKEMYTFPDRKDRSLTMRPEATAGVMRAFIESGRQKNQEGVARFFTTGPMFRYERPQKGRMRQFHQINCECLGPTEPEADAEMLLMVMRFLEALGIDQLALQLNGLGCAACRPVYRETLRHWLKELDPSGLCEDCRRRLDTNPLRVLDCKVPSCRELTAGAPEILAHNCPDCAAHFAAVRALLDAEGLAYVINPRLVRGLDYYTRTTFEVVSDRIGAQGTVAGGGRYDGLVAQLGGPDLPGLGFACGMERLAMLLPEQEAPRPDFALAVVGVADEASVQAKAVAFGLVQALRDAGLTGEMSFAVRSVKSALRLAGRNRARKALLLGPDELICGEVTVKDLDTGAQERTRMDEAVRAFAG